MNSQVNICLLQISVPMVPQNLQRITAGGYFLLYQVDGEFPKKISLVI